MISKELLEVVYPNTERYTYRISSHSGKPVVEAIDHEWQGMIGTINTYEVMNKCKEWAYKVQKGNIGKWLSPTKSNEWEHDKFACYVNGYPDKYVYGDTEPEAVFEACEWILKELENEKR